LYCIKKIFSLSSLKSPFGMLGAHQVIEIFILLFCFILVEWFGRNRAFPLSYINKKTSIFLRWPIYYCLILIIVYYSNASNGIKEFIYFQF
jgi:hypothetical protein